ncbi:unnamed protein product [Kuraishia capsulata CBS 1993]|uniref:Uncharacterized protein n=1 Tax=Kuraishia capsulata CBS 1993 TaxID=1382522 RepID=W6MFM7_9ASCO|nr:uncharacterized protein KUCA_T00000620001 [Kuraishia capsulata CBS 1993]CDK24654.1 unnamed protein product [Kuraishia capsulata CBS 1993]
MGRLYESHASSESESGAESSSDYEYGEAKVVTVPLLLLDVTIDKVEEEKHLEEQRAGTERGIENYRFVEEIEQDGLSFVFPSYDQEEIHEEKQDPNEHQFKRKHKKDKTPPKDFFELLVTDCTEIGDPDDDDDDSDIAELPFGVPKSESLSIRMLLMDAEEDLPLLLAKRSDLYSGKLPWEDLGMKYTDLIFIRASFRIEEIDDFSVGSVETLEVYSRDELANVITKNDILYTSGLLERLKKRLPQKSLQYLDELVGGSLFTSPSPPLPYTATLLDVEIPDLKEETSDESEVEDEDNHESCMNAMPSDNTEPHEFVDLYPSSQSKGLVS